MIPLIIALMGVLPKPVEKPYADTAIGAVIDANAGKIPVNGVELVAALAKLGDFLQLAIPFSAVDSHSGLTHPRVVFALRPSTHPIPFVDSGYGGGWGGGFNPRATPMPRPKPRVMAAPSPLGETEANRPQLEGRLFLAANTELRGVGRPVVTSVEFLSWNTTSSKFDFGVIEGLGGGKPELKILDGKRCFSCHKNRGPILGDAPWSNTMHNPAVKAAAKAQLKFPHGLDENGREDPKLAVLDTIDGLKLLHPQAVEVDAAVRQAADRLRDRAAIERLVKTENGRLVLAQMLHAIAADKPIGDDKAVRYELDRIDLVKFLQEEAVAQKATPPNRLLDFNPAGKSVRRYEAVRAGGESGLPSAHQPSNPKAFARSGKPPSKASEAVSVLALARAIGLSEADRGFLVTRLMRAERPVPLAPNAMAKLIFAGPSFADLFESGILPDRDDFKDRFVAGLSEVAGGAGDVHIERKHYARTPRRDPNYRAAQEKVLAPSHACLACHDIRGAKSTGFNPIVPLAFDPFDTPARSAWLKTADRTKRIQVLGRMAQRLSTDRDMPPEDSPEADAFRGKEFDAVKDWLAAELKKAKG